MIYRIRRLLKFVGPNFYALSLVLLDPLLCRQAVLFDVGSSTRSEQASLSKRMWPQNICFVGQI